MHMRLMTSLAAALLTATTVAVAQVSSLPDRPAQKPPGTAVLRGHVVEAATGQPVRRALVRLSSLDGNKSRVAATDSDGAYEITELQAGRYTIGASKNPFVASIFRQTRSSERGATLTVLDGQTIERVDISLQRGGVITGRVVDDFGEPMSGVQLAATQSRMMNGVRTITFSRVAMTNDLGEFRLFGLAPGDYFVRGAWRRTGAAVGSADDGMGYAPTYFPSTTNVGDAQRLKIGVGTSISGVIVAMTPAPTATISGTAVDSHGAPMKGGISLMSAGGMGAWFGASLRPDGSFRIESVTPGDYILQGQAGPDEMATMPVSVAGVDITDVRLVGTPPVSVSGRIAFDPTQSPLPIGSNVMATPAYQDVLMGFGRMTPGMAGADGAFTLKTSPGRRRLDIPGLPNGWAVRAVRFRGVDVTNDGIEIKANQNVEDVEIDVTDRVTMVVGLVTDASGGASKDYVALVFPQDEHLWTNPARYIKVGRPDEDGRFRIEKLPPGEYYAVALDHFDFGSMSDPDLLRAQRTNATALSLGEGETRSIELRLTTTGS